MQNGAVTYAVEQGLHPSDGPSERITQNADAIYFVVVVFVQRCLRPKLPRHLSSEPRPTSMGWAVLTGLLRTAGAYTLRVDAV